MGDCVRCRTDLTGDEMSDGETCSNCAAQPEVEPAVVCMAMMREFGTLDHAVQVSVANNVLGILKKVLEQTMDRVGEERAVPLGIAVSLVEGLFKSKGRVVFLREAEAGIMFHQPSRLLLATGESQMDVNFVPPLAGHGERAAGTAGLALKLLNEHSTRCLAEVITS